MTNPLFHAPSADGPGESDDDGYEDASENMLRQLVRDARTGDGVLAGESSDTDDSGEDYEDVDILET